MKIFLLLITIIYGIGIFQNLFSLKSQKESMDKTLIQNDLNTEEDKKIYMVTSYFMLILPVLYIGLSIKFIGTFLFAVIGILYLFWTLYDFNNSILYLSKGIVTKVYDSKLYRKLGIPFDLAFVIYIIYQLYTRWQN